MNTKQTLHVISHTHWDREWYRSFQDFRSRLVELIDYLLDLMEDNPDYRYFHLDGHTALVDDYLEIRPEHRERLQGLIEAGRILVGPWFVLPDEFLVSGESIIRNLLRGHQQARVLGGVMRVGYIPDTFGHISQMPQILRGFGIDNAILFRGITADQAGSEFLWRGPDGSEVLTANMSDDTAYSNFFYHMLPVLTSDEPLENTPIAEAVDAMVDDRRSQTEGRHLLAMDGVDHVFPNPRSLQIIDWINENHPDLQVIQTTLPRYMEALHWEGRELASVSGELRAANRRWRLQAILAGVLSSRMPLKQKNERIQTLMERWVEPAAAVAWLLGQPYPHAYIWKAWEELLLNHPHDSICGCSIDQVHQDMLYRYDQAQMIAERLAAAAQHTIAGSVDTSWLEDAEQGVVVFNPLSWARSELVEAVIDFPAETPLDNLQVRFSDGTLAAHQLVTEEQTWVRHQAPHDIPRAERVTRATLLIDPGEVPALGCVALGVQALPGVRRAKGSLVVSPTCVENDLLRLSVNANGTFDLHHRASGRTWSGLGYLLDDGDAGTGYDYSPPPRDAVISSLTNTAAVHIVEAGPLRTVLRVEVPLALPQSLTEDRRARSDNTTVMLVRTELTVQAGSDRLDCRTSFHNTVQDHRIRVCFPTDVRADKVHVESTFDIVARDVANEEGEDWLEKPPSTHPQQRFADVNDGCGGLTIINQGLPEYEVLPHRTTFALTLLRCVGKGVGHDHELRDGQCLGDFTCEYALRPHTGSVEEDCSWQAAHNHSAPLEAIQTDKHTGALSSYSSVLRLSDPKVMVTAVKKCETRDSLIVRLLNMSAQPCEVNVGLPSRVQEVHRANPNEERLGSCARDTDCLPLSLGGKELATLEIVH